MGMQSERPRTDEILQFGHDRPPATGTLLAAAPNLQDPNFRKRVVFLCEHGPEGSFGLVLNAPLPMRLGEVIERHQSSVSLSQGGPVQQSTLHFLHRRSDLELGSREVAPGLYWGGDFEKVLRLLEHRKLHEDDVRFFAGFSGWGPNQLQEEMKQSSWYTVPCASDLIFSQVRLGDEESLWKTVLRGLGSKYEILFNYPPDPALN